MSERRGQPAATDVTEGSFGIDCVACDRSAHVHVHAQVSGSCEGATEGARSLACTESCDRDAQQQVRGRPQHTREMHSVVGQGPGAHAAWVMGLEASRLKRADGMQAHERTERAADGEAGE